MKTPTFSKDFPTRTVTRLTPMLPAMCKALSEVVGFKVDALPSPIYPLSEAHIREGKGKPENSCHGRLIWKKMEIHINSHMPPFAVFITLIHEYLHFVLPMVTEMEINRELLPRVYKLATGREFPWSRAKKWLRKDTW